MVAADSAIDDRLPSTGQRDPQPSRSSTVDRALRPVDAIGSDAELHSETSIEALVDVLDFLVVITESIVLSLVAPLQIFDVLLELGEALSMVVDLRPQPSQIHSDDREITRLHHLVELALEVLELLLEVLELLLELGVLLEETAGALQELVDGRVHRLDLLLRDLDLRRDPSLDQVELVTGVRRRAEGRRREKYDVINHDLRDELLHVCSPVSDLPREVGLVGLRFS